MTHHFNDKHHDHFMKKVSYLDNQQRNTTLPPEKFLAMIPLTATDSLLDLGAGTGFLTLPAAKQSGNVYALDLSAKMLELIATRAVEADLANIQLLNASIDDIPLEDNTVDHVLASLVLHELSDLETALGQVHRVLKPGGHFAILELEQSDHGHDHHGAPRLEPTTLINSLKEAGFILKDQHHTSDSLYVLIAQK